MKFLNKSLLSVTCASLLASGAMFTSSNAHADLTAAAGVASAYYWRGLQVSEGAQVWGELTYALDSGFYGDLWASSEGFGVGPEYDLSVGWSGKLGDLGVNVGAVTYVYSKDPFMQNCNTELGDTCLDDNDPGDFSDVYVKLSLGPAFLGVYHNVALLQGQDWIYTGFTAGKFTFTVGHQQFKDVDHLAVSGYPDDVNKASYTYAEVAFAATKNLTMTVSSVLDNKDMEFVGVPARADTNRAKVVVSYSLPIEM